MKISTKAQYAVRFLIDLALHDGEGHVSLKEVARRQTISQKYLWQVVNPLKSAGVLHTTQGARGGYALARPASEITLFDILAVLEGDGALVPCLAAPAVCPRSGACAPQEAWKEVDGKLASALRSITLEAMVEKQRGMVTEPVMEYSI